MDTYQKTWRDRSLLSDLQEINKIDEELGFHSEPKDFGSTSFCDNLAGDVIVYIHEPLNELMNENLTIIDYGEKVKRIGLTFIVFEDNSDQHEEVFFNPVKGYLGFQLLLDAQLISESDQSEVQVIVAQSITTYLEKLEPTDIVHIDTDEPLPDLDFHLEKFKSDLKEVFITEEWLP